MHVKNFREIEFLITNPMLKQVTDKFRWHLLLFFHLRNQGLDDILREVSNCTRMVRCYFKTDWKIKRQLRAPYLTL